MNKITQILLLLASVSTLTTCRTMARSGGLNDAAPGEYLYRCNGADGDFNPYAWGRTRKTNYQEALDIGTEYCKNQGGLNTVTKQQ